MTTALLVEEEPESVNGNAAPNTNHQLIQSLVPVPDCSKEEWLYLDVVVGMCVTSGTTVWMWPGGYGSSTAVWTIRDRLVYFQPKGGCAWQFPQIPTWQRGEGECLWNTSALGISSLLSAQCRRLCGAQLFFCFVLGVQVPG